MNPTAIQSLITALFTFLDSESMDRIYDAILDVAEDASQQSDNKVDDKIVLPICAKLRERHSIPEFDT